MAQYKSPKILFMCGLESGPKGKKSEYLKAHFTSVITPNMQMSLYNLKKKNSVIRNILRSKILHLGLIVVVILVMYTIKYPSLITIACCFLSLAFFISFKKHIVTNALNRSLEQCISIQTEMLKMYAPDIVVGSSWGGVVAVMCAQRGTCSCPMLLIAPAIKLVCSKLGKNWKEIGILPQKIKIIHGECDTTVPIQDSVDFANYTGAQLKIITNGDHSLNNALIMDEKNQLENSHLQQEIIELIQE